MASCANRLSTNNESLSYQDAINLSNESPSRSRGNKDEEEEYDEDEDVDFNPFLKETPSPAASSSLSCEIEALDSEIFISPGNNSINSLKSSGVVHNLDGRGHRENGEESAVRSNLSSEGKCDRDSQNVGQKEWTRKNSDSVSWTEDEPLMEKEHTTNWTVEVNESGEGLCDTINTQKPMLKSNEEDAICMRTRARYSLASITLDELEAFLQETDDEDEIQNVNDEEEYRKFLAAVLQGGDEEGQSVQKNENSEDDDEDNDADFEIELEEALESDDEEGAREKARTGDDNSTMQRPATRRNRQQNFSMQRKKNSPVQPKRPLRPLVPILPTGPVPQLLRRPSATETVATSGNNQINGFSQPQIGQLHCLIHEHVQLLIQVYSLCVLDPSRQEIATQAQELISEMLHRREESLSCQSQSHSLVTGPASSVLDVAALDLAGRYLDDISNAVRDYRRSQVESGCDASSERVPLFPLPHSFPHQGTGNEVLDGSPLASNTNQLPSGQQEPKKTLAGTLVESAKKQSIALVQKDIAKLVQRFFPSFNPLLFPHKPPPAAVASRVLFTDAEDELLALGIMEYNSDWKAIQQRFLPCKSKHQIFVRQKNRCSSKALENPIKAVRRMKSSPLSAEEISRIQEGLRYYKFDWMSVWKFVVPYRDPSLLPRQWRIALGVQKSYKQDDAKKEKRRLYELKRRSRALLTNEQLGSDKEDCHGATNDNENNVGDELVDNPSEAYVHEGFLADWKAGTSNLPMYSVDKAKDVPVGNLQSVVGMITRLQSENPEPSGAPVLTGNMQRFVPTLMPPDHYISGSATASSRPQIVLRPYRARKLYNPRVVRLAPELPPVNLPPSVRVISQSVFTKNHSEASSKAYTVRVGISDVPGRENSVPQHPHLSANGDKNCPPGDKVVGWQQDESEVAEEIRGVEERNTDSDLQMHPLLFRNPENGHVTCYSLNSGPGGSGSFSFFPDKRPRLLSLFNSPRQVNLSADKFQKVVTLDGCNAASGDIGFHPLLQRIEYPNGGSCSTVANLSPSVGTNGKSCQNQDLHGAVKKTPTVSSQPSSSSGEAKKIDLDTHVSPISSKVKDICGNIAADTSEAQIICLMQDNPANCGTHGSEVCASPAPTDGISRCMDEIGDQSNLGIVMEQEELSDSDEDMEEENVEFECEEMADSEGDEGSGCEENATVQDKDKPSSAVENTVTDADSESERGVENPIFSQPNISNPLEGGQPSSRPSVTELGKDSMSSPWLSLDSSSRRLSRKTSKYTDKTTIEEPANKMTTALCGPSRSCKKRTPTKRRVAESKEDVDIARLLSLGPLSIPTVKKPRKRVSRANSNGNIETAQEMSRFYNRDKSC